ncbi:MAG: class I SAM-dependent methyltransferase [Anaerolineaceae bacterium]|nr:class I SAM-dependent methyltransferase [Anaerolineaceae bacterium]
MRVDDLLQEQIAYYRARAAEYDQWALRQGRYDHGPELNQLWHDQVDEVRQALLRCGPLESALELACGTGIWTQELLKISQRVHAIDAAPEMLAINRAKLLSDRVSYEQADLFTWRPQHQYDLAFCGFWLSHVPPEHMAPFLQQVAEALRPGGRLFLVDSRRAIYAGASDHSLRDPHSDSILDERKLNDGRRFTIVKVFHEPEQLGASLRDAGLQPTLRLTESYFIYGWADKP